MVDDVKEYAPDALKIADRIGLTIHELLRYGFGGFVALGAAALTCPKAVTNAVTALGPVLFGLSAFAAGAAIYVLVRSTSLLLVVIVAEHIYRQILKCYTTMLPTRSAYLNRKYGFGFFEAEDAWRAVNRNHPWSGATQTRFYRQHSEIHLLHVTVLVLIVFGVWHWLPWLVVFGLLLAAVAGFADILLSRQEYTELQRNEAAVEKILLESGFHFRRPSSEN